MHFTYVLISIKNKRLYIGSTSNVERRLKEHNRGSGGTYTKNNRPFELVFYEAFKSKVDAEKQELFYKSGYGKEVLKEKAKNSLKHWGIV